MSERINRCSNRCQYLLAVTVIRNYGVINCIGFRNFITKAEIVQSLDVGFRILNPFLYLAFCANAGELENQQFIVRF